MIRNLKVLGLLAFAALAMSAMFAAGAQAQTNGVLTAGHNEPEGEHTTSTIIGHQEPEIDGESSAEEVEEWKEWNFFEGTKGAGDKIECDIATLTGTTETGTEDDIKVAPHYTHCRAEGSQDAIVKTNGCEYTLEQTTKVATHEYEGGAALTCPIVEGVHQQIEVDVYLSGNATNTGQFFKLCTIEIGPAPESEEAEGHTKDPLDGKIVYNNLTNEPTEDDITATVEIEGIYSDATDCEKGTSEEGTYTSTVTVEALEDEGEQHEEQFDLWISDEE